MQKQIPKLRDARGFSSCFLLCFGLLAFQKSRGNVEVLCFLVFHGYRSSESSLLNQNKKKNKTKPKPEFLFSFEGER